MFLRGIAYVVSDWISSPACFLHSVSHGKEHRACTTASVVSCCTTEQAAAEQARTAGRASRRHPGGLAWERAARSADRAASLPERTCHCTGPADWARRRGAQRAGRRKASPHRGGPSRRGGCSHYAAAHRVKSRPARSQATVPCWARARARAARRRHGDTSVWSRRGFTVASGSAAPLPLTSPLRCRRGRAGAIQG